MSHKMYYDPSSTHSVSVFRGEPYHLHVENKDDMKKAIIINITKESQGEVLHDLVNYKLGVPR